MDGRSSARSALRDNMAFWEKFFAGCIGLRVDSHRFERVAPIAQRSHPLPPSAIADLFLRPTLSNRTSLDPWVPVYLQTLTKLGFIDTSSILRALYKYSSSHQLVPAADVATGDHTQAGRVDPSKCWSNSYWVEEYMFYRLLKTVVENREDQDSRAVLEVVRSVSRWMALFAAASTALASAMIDPMAHAHEAVRREGFDSARAAFVALLWRLCENEPIIRIISKPAATGPSSFLHGGRMCVFDTDFHALRDPKGFLRQSGQVYPLFPIPPAGPREAGTLPFSDPCSPRSSVKGPRSCQCRYE